MKKMIIKKRKSIRAITPVVGTILMIGLTIAVGFAAWAWARSAAVNSEKNFGNAISCNLASLKESFTIVNVNFSLSVTSPADEKVSVWLYNYGNTTVYIKEMWISNSTWSPNGFTGNTPVSTCSGSVNYYAQLPVGQVTILTLQTTSTFTSGSTYQFKALSVYANTNTFQQTR